MKTSLVHVTIVLVMILIPWPTWASDFNHKHSLWDQILEKYVMDNGPSSSVKYLELKQQDQPKLDKYLLELSSVNSPEYDSWKKSQQLAYLINVYNAYTIKLVLDHYPVDSIKDIGNFFRSSWKIKFFKLFGDETHLDYVEHSLIRGENGFAEPRIHFALVCASVGCPKLQVRAFTADRLEEMLEYGVQAFLADTTRNRFDVTQNKLHLSSIFKWYGVDFISQSGSVKAYVARYMSSDQQIQSLIQSRQIDLNYLDYDWSLNDAR